MVLLLAILAFLLGVMSVELFRRAFDFHSFLKPQTKTWIGFDLDGTLAKTSSLNFNYNKIGTPVPAIIRLARQYLADGLELKILSGRVSTEDGIFSVWRAIKARRQIQKWTKKHLGKKLAVVCSKDSKMSLLYDDRAIQVLRNKGELVANNKANQLFIKTEANKKLVNRKSLVLKTKPFYSVILPRPAVALAKEEGRA